MDESPKNVQEALDDIWEHLGLIEESIMVLAALASKIPLADKSGKSVVLPKISDGDKGSRKRAIRSWLEGVNLP